MKASPRHQIDAILSKQADLNLDSCPGVSCMPSSSSGSALTILVTKLTHNREPGQVKEMKKMKMTGRRCPKWHCSS